jgi:hypothetical protein
MSERMLGFSSANDERLLGAFWLAFAATLTPWFNAENAFTANATTAAEKAAGIAQFEACLGKSSCSLWNDSVRQLCTYVC